MYLDFATYQSYGGAIDNATTFDKYEYKARKKIDYYTFDRLVGVEDIPEDVQRCMFDLIDNLYNYDVNGASDIASVSNDGLSISYLTGEKYSNNNKIENIVNTYLMHTIIEKEVDGTTKKVKLLYRGL